MKKAFIPVLSALLLLMAGCSHTSTTSGPGSWTFAGTTYTSQVSAENASTNSIFFTADTNTTNNRLLFQFPTFPPVAGNYTPVPPSTILPSAGTCFFQISASFGQSSWVSDGLNSSNVVVTVSPTGKISISASKLEVDSSPPTFITNVNVSQ